MKAQTKRFLGILILAGAALAVGCDNGSTDTTVTADISIPAITAVANPMQFGPVSAYTGWDDNFPHSDVTYTLILSKGGAAKVTVNSTTATIISATGQPDDVYTITQTFYYKGNPISGGSRSVAIMITSNAFGIGAGMAVSEDDFSPSSLTALTLSLSKKL